MENNIGEARREYADRVGGFTQKDAAEYFGVSLSTYKKWEQGQGKLNGGILREISSKYGVTVDYLLDVKAKPRIDYAVVPFPDFTEDERDLINLWRRMDDRQRDRIMDDMRDFALANDAKKKAVSRDTAPGTVDAVR